jgi:hypothetical protein
MPYDPELADALRAALRGRRNIVEKKMFGGYCTGRPMRGPPVVDVCFSRSLAYLMVKRNHSTLVCLHFFQVQRHVPVEA